MKKLTIHNIGPVKDVELNLNRVNVIMGPQCAGKSCILKIACFCAWAEKRIELEQDKNGFADFSYIEENLLGFHKLGGFVKPGSRFAYKTSHLEFVCDFDNRTFNLTFNSAGRWKYKRSRVAYIPAERNLVAVIPNWLDVRLGNTNLSNFVSDWDMTRRLFVKDNALKALNLGVDYYYDEDKKVDVVRMENGDTIDFSAASSGVQSVIPMQVFLDYLFHKQYTNPLSNKVFVDSENENILQHIYQKKFQRGLRNRLGDKQPYIDKIGPGKLTFASEDEYKECKALFDSFTKTAYSEIYLEEPEQNLFPQTQVELVYSLLSNAAEHQDNIFIASHSPYILYALNNCMLGGLVKKKAAEEAVGMFDFSKSWINPKDVCVWELRDGGVTTATENVLNTIQDKKGLIRSNYFDRVMQNVMADFKNLLNFYKS